jgi:hypothetical protein
MVGHRRKDVRRRGEDKSEIRNPKSETMTKSECRKGASHPFAGFDIRHSSFAFASSFGSDFELCSG